MDALLRRRAMMAAGGGTPPTPTNVAYIRGGADGSYIDTGITADSTTKVIVWARNWNPTSSFLFGSRTSTGVDGFSLGTHTGTQTGLIRVDYAQTNITLSSDAYDKLGWYHKYELYHGVCKVDDVVVATATQSAFSNQFNIHIIGNNNGGTHMDANLPIDICACKIYKNDVLVRDYTAVNTPSIGLYDAISNTVFTNAGSGSFTYGTFNPNAYTPLQYVSCTNAQYIDTGIYGRGSTQVVTKFRIVGTSVSYPSIFGTLRSGTASTYFLLQLGDATTKNRYADFYINSTSPSSLYANTSVTLTDRDVVFAKTSTTATLYENNARIGTQRTFSIPSSFVTPDTLLLGGENLNQSPRPYGFMYGYIYYAGFGAERNFVPGLNNNVAGMYDTYNDVFYPSATETPFVAGPTL